MQTLDNFWSIFNSIHQRTPAPAPKDAYQYFWDQHPEKDRTAVARYESMGGQAEPLGGEVGRETSGYGANPVLPDQNPMSASINRLPIKLRQKYLSLLGPAAPDSYASQR